jgi:pimeloyl-ACP methyl ester carboxylesterase
MDEINMQRSFSYQQKNISYRIEGKGLPVVLLHGFGEDNHIWDLQIDYLKEYCLLIVPDLPGSGSSQLLISHDPGQFISIDDYADCMQALLNHENISFCIMLGHSMGGYITLAFVEKYADRLTAFGLVHSTAYADSAEKKLNRTKGIELMETYGGQQFLKATIPNLFGEKFKQAHPGKIDDLIASAASFSTPALQQYYVAMRERPDRSRLLQSNPFPVLFVIGTADVAAPMQDVLQQTHLPLKSYIHVLEGVGHMGMWEAPGQLNQYLLAFIKS